MDQTMSIWQIRIQDDRDQRVCIAQLTMAFLECKP
jgi:hypothetical protein